MVASVFAMGVTMVSAVPQEGTLAVDTQASQPSAAASTQSDGAKGGYITGINITGTTQTCNWQGYYGNVSGNIVLRDSGSNTMYEWASVDNPLGEVYATRASAIPVWASIAVAGAGQITSEDNLIPDAANDEVADTFIVRTITAFDVGTVPISANAPRAWTYKDGSSQTTDFEEIMLYDTANVIYATILEQNMDGFKSDNTTYDYQMIVPEDNCGNDVATSYYFYAELE